MSTPSINSNNTVVESSKISIEKNMEAPLLISSSGSSITRRASNTSLKEDPPFLLKQTEPELSFISSPLQVTSPPHVEIQKIPMISSTNKNSNNEILTKKKSTSSSVSVSPNTSIEILSNLINDSLIQFGDDKNDFAFKSNVNDIVSSSLINESSTKNIPEQKQDLKENLNKEGISDSDVLSAILNMANSTNVLKTNTNPPMVHNTVTLLAEVESLEKKYHDLTVNSSSDNILIKTNNPSSNNNTLEQANKDTAKNILSNCLEFWELLRITTVKSSFKIY
jgi:hypothetical protein